MTTSREIIEAALGASTLSEAMHVQALLRSTGQVDFDRPLGDTWNNHGLMGSSGNYDFKLIELATNMQDAVLELFALKKFGSDHDVPYTSPHAAARDLFANMSEPEMAELATVTFRESDVPASKTKRLTAVFRDKGCGLTPYQVPRTIFRLGGSRKEDALFLQGAFGMGGAMTYRNAEAVVLITRRDPALLNGEEDRITVAVVEWRDNTKGRTALYLVDNEWNDHGDEGEPWSCPAEDVPEFEPGCHLALISYRTDGIHRKTERDDRVFNTVADTRLFDPVMPLMFTNQTDRGRRTILRGLKGRLDRTSASEFPSDSLTLPFRIGTETYHLPIRYVMFAPIKQAGGVDKFVALGHAVMFTSNGQVHHHWTPAEFRQKTGFNKIYNRVLVVVETDELPILVRTSLFTSDRSHMVRTDNAIRLEEAVIGALQGWDELANENSELVRAALRAGGDQLTAELGRKIGMAFKATGFGFSTGPGRKGGPGTSGGGRSGGGKAGHRKTIELHPDPTKVSGATEIQAELNSNKSMSFVVDVVDDFWNGRGSLAVTCDHPEIGEREITVGKGRRGRVRVLLAIPETTELGTYTVTARLADWHKAGGGLGPELEWTTKLELVEEIEGKNTGGGKRNTNSGDSGESGVGAGGNVALRWTDHLSQENWSKTTVGEVEEIRAADLASSVSGYEELASLGDTEIPTISLNEEYPPFKSYLETRSRELTELDRPREQYALGVGLALLVINEGAQRAAKKDAPWPESVVAEAGRAAARGVLAVMPQFDQLIKQAGLAVD